MRMTSMNEKEATRCGTRPVGRCSRSISTCRTRPKRSRSRYPRRSRSSSETTATSATDSERSPRSTVRQSPTRWYYSAFDCSTDPATSDVTDLDVRDKTITSELASLVTAQKSTLAEPVRHRLDQGGNSKKPLDIGASAGPIPQARVRISSHL